MERRRGCGSAASAADLTPGLLASRECSLAVSSTYQCTPASAAHCASRPARQLRRHAAPRESGKCASAAAEDGFVADALDGAEPFHFVVLDIGVADQYDQGAIWMQEARYHWQISVLHIGRMYGGS